MHRAAVETRKRARRMEKINHIQSIDSNLAISEVFQCGKFGARMDTGRYESTYIRSTTLEWWISGAKIISKINQTYIKHQQQQKMSKNVNNKINK
jgi:hypothetical protein